MSIITSSQRQKAVYWPRGVSDEFGNPAPGTAVEINCRWEDRHDMFLDAGGEEQISKSVVTPNRDVVVGGWLWLGTLASCPAALVADPQAGDLADGFSLDTLMPFIDKIKTFLLTSTDILLELIYDFAPNIKKEKTWIEDHATDPEVFSVFLEVLKMAYPFGSVLGNLRTLGQSPQQTTMNSLEQNGDSGPTN